MVVLRKTAVVAGNPVAVVGNPVVGDNLAVVVGSPAAVADSHHTVPVGDIRSIRIVVAVAVRRRSWSP